MQRPDHHYSELKVSILSWLPTMPKKIEMCSRDKSMRGGEGKAPVYLSAVDPTSISDSRSELQAKGAGCYTGPIAGNHLLLVTNEVVARSKPCSLQTHFQVGELQGQMHVCMEEVRESSHLIVSLG